MEFGMSKIERLTKEQEEYLPVFRQKYLDMACDGIRIDRDSMQNAYNTPAQQVARLKKAGLNPALLYGS